MGMLASFPAHVKAAETVAKMSSWAAITNAAALVEGGKAVAARDALIQLSKEAETSARQKVREVALLARLTIQMAEKERFADAFGFVDQTLAAIQAAKLAIPADDTEAQRFVTSTEAYLYDKILHDQERALLAYEDCLALGLKESSMDARVAQLKSTEASVRLYGLATPTINQAFASRLRGARLVMTKQADESVALSVQAEGTGQYRVEISSDLVSWTTLFRTSNVPASPHLLNLSEQSPQTFFRVVAEGSDSAK